jgi:hypothetical protein
MADAQLAEILGGGKHILGHPAAAAVNDTEDEMGDVFLELTK